MTPIIRLLNGLECRIAFVNIPYNKFRVAVLICVMNKKMLPLPACRIAFVIIHGNKLRVASPNCLHNGFVNILYNKLGVASPICLWDYTCKYSLY